MDKLIVGICENDRSDRDRLEASLNASGISLSCNWFKSGEDFIASFSNGKYDAVFLDVYMDGMSGVDVAQRIRKTDQTVAIAFVTTSADHALDGYRYHVERYLQKPFRTEDVREFLSLAANRAASLPSITLRTKVKDETIPQTRIRYAEQLDHSVILYLAGGGKRKFTGKLDSLQTLLPPSQFYRCHKSFLVNLDHVARIDQKLNVFQMKEGGNAYIRRGSMKEAARALESWLLSRMREANG